MTIEDREKKLRKQIYFLLGNNIGKYLIDESLPWDERYKQLETHHIQETEYLIKLLVKWGLNVQDLDRRVMDLEKAMLDMPVDETRL